MKVIARATKVRVSDQNAYENVITQLIFLSHSTKIQRLSTYFSKNQTSLVSIYD